MIKSGLPNSPGRRLTAGFLLLCLLALFFGQIYVRATFESRPRWLELAGPATFAIIGLAVWLFPEGWPSMSPTKRGLLASFFIAVSALSLLFYFV